MFQQRQKKQALIEIFFAHTARTIILFDNILLRVKIVKMYHECVLIKRKFLLLT
jgi:hypothetical protein